MLSKLFRKSLVLSIAIVAALASVTAAQAWETPQRGTQLRKDLMDAMRPHAMQVFGAPILFVVEDLRVEGNVAFAMLEPVRPNGAKITFDDLRPSYRQYEDRNYWAGPHMQALYERIGRTWVATHQVHGATDVWWADPQFCPKWHSVIPEYCGN